MLTKFIYNKRGAAHGHWCFHSYEFCCGPKNWWECEYVNGNRIGIFKYHFESGETKISFYAK